MDIYISDISKLNEWLVKKTLEIFEKIKEIESIEEEEEGEEINKTRRLGKH